MLCFIIANEERDELCDTINSVIVSQRVSGGGEQSGQQMRALKLTWLLIDVNNTRGY